MIPKIKNNNCNFDSVDPYCINIVKEFENISEFMKSEETIETYMLDGYEDRITNELNKVEAALSSPESCLGQ